MLARGTSLHGSKNWAAAQNSQFARTAFLAMSVIASCIGQLTSFETYYQYELKSTG